MKVLFSALTALLALHGAAVAQAIGGNASLNAGTTSSAVALPSTDRNTYPAALIAPAPGVTTEAFYKLGSSSVEAALTSPALPAGGICVALGPATHMAAITATSTAQLRITQLTQCPIFGR